MVEQGYGSADYADSFSEFGEIICLPHSQLRVLKRHIDRERFDLTGLYPISSCQNWAGIRNDFSFLADLGAVSLVLVSDPFAQLQVEETSSEWSLCRSFKTHFVVDLRQDWRAQRAKNTRNYTNRARRLQTTEVVATDELNDSEFFFALYRNILSRHNVHGIQGLSPDAIRKQLMVAGGMLVVAQTDTVVTGAMLSYHCGEIAHLHLMGLSVEAYELGTSYALIYAALEELETRGCRYVNLGGTSGASDDTTSGLYNFKRRWSNDRRTSMLCGQILDNSAYEALASQTHKDEIGYFPAYRASGSIFEWQPNPAERQ